MSKLFDLNIEQVLEHWKIEHALREIIANALDEQQLTNTDNIKIFQDSKNAWHIRDYGRGLQYHHFTQNENYEKINSSNLIGKFGVGLKDALAVLYRHGIDVKIHSKYALITTEINQKNGFEIETLHAKFDKPVDENMVGTDFIFSGISSKDVDNAKKMFLFFNQNKLLESTKYGEVYENINSKACIYINGIEVANEDNFMFSYNITNITSQIKKSLNRERTNVGRSAYSESIKKILTNCKNNTILLSLMNDLNNIMLGTNKDESTWSDVSVYAAKNLNDSNNVVFLTPTERNDLTNAQVEILKNSGKQIVLITDSIKAKIDNVVTTFNDIVEEYNKSFSYIFVPYEKLTTTEKIVFNTKLYVIDILRKHNYRCDMNILISETIQPDVFGNETLGICDGSKIIIKRSVLTNDDFCAILLHEIAHYESGYTDNTRDFENELTNMLGILMAELLKRKENIFFKIFK